MKRFVAMLSLWALCTSGVFAQQVKVFLNNQAFKGKVAGSPADLSLEAEAVFKSLGRKIEMNPEGNSIHVDEGKELAVADGMVRAKDLVTIFGGKYDFNKSLNSVDIYAYDPVAAARKSLISILKLRQVKNESDFQVCVFLTKQTLIQDLGLKLDTPDKVLLSTPQEMAKAGAGGDVGCLVSFHGERRGSGTADYEFRVRNDQGAVEMISDLAWSWGLTWANLRGVSKNERLSLGFAYWTSYKVVARLTGMVSDGHIRRQAQHGHPAAAEGYKELRELEKNGGVEAVIKYIKDIGAKS